jgi:hypothetical protein
MVSKYFKKLEKQESLSPIFFFFRITSNLFNNKNEELIKFFEPSQGRINSITSFQHYQYPQAGVDIKEWCVQSNIIILSFNQ